MEETPWAMVQRMRAEQAPLDRIVLALQQRGLSREDVELLVKDAVPAVRRVEKVEADLSISTKPGAPLRWAGIVLAECGLLFAAWPREDTAWLPTAVASGLALGALLYGELRSGVRRTLKKLGFVHFFVGALPAFAAFISGVQPWNVPFVVGFATAVPLIVWAGRTGEKLKGLKDFLPGATVFEENGVQFVAAWPESPQVAPGEAVEVVVLVQNCVDAERTIVLDLQADAQAVIGDRHQTLSLLPGCVVEIMIPLRPQPLAPPVLRAVLDVAVTGTQEGPRVRLAKGERWVSPSAQLRGNVVGLVALAAVGVGSVSLGANGGIRIKVDATKPFVDEARVTRVTTLFQPTPEQLKKAATS